MKKIRHAVIMAAGRGTRMLPLTAAIPKPMAPFNGSTLVAEGISRIANHVDFIHVTVGYKGAMLAKHVVDLSVASVLNTDGRGNSWWVYNTLLNQLNEPAFVLTCDNLVQLDFKKIEDDYFEQGAPACMVVPTRPVDGHDGDYITADGSMVTSLCRNQRTDRYCSGIQVMNPRKTANVTEPTESFYDVWGQLIDQKLLSCSSVYPTSWVAIDTLVQLQSAEYVEQNRNARAA